MNPMDDMYVDRYGMDSMRLIHRKYSTDYLEFFLNLSRAYSKGKIKKDIDEVVRMIKEVVGIIEGMMVGGKISVKESSRLYSLVDEIEDRKLDLMGQAEKVKALHDRMDGVTGEIGVSVKDLNMTREMAKYGVKRARLGMKESTRSGRLAPRSMLGRHTGKVFEGVKVAALGPFAPVLDIMTGVIKDLFGMLGMGKSLGTQRKIGGPTSIGPFASPTFPGFIGADPRGRSMDLFVFFNTLAYRAKWTRELLDRIKKAEGERKGPSWEGISKWLKALAIGGVFATGVGAAAGVVGAVGKYSKAKGAEEKSVSNLDMAIRQRQEYRKEVGERKADEKGITAESIERLERLREEAARKAGKGPGTIVGLSPLATGLTMITEFLRHKGEKPTKQVGPIIQPGEKKQTGKVPLIADDRLDEIAEGAARIIQPPTGGKHMSQKPVSIDTSELDKIVKGAAEEMKKMSRSVDELARSVERGREVPSIKLPGVGNQYDSADPLVTAHASGDLTINR